MTENSLGMIQPGPSWPMERQRRAWRQAETTDSPPREPEQIMPTCYFTEWPCYAETYDL